MWKGYLNNMEIKLENKDGLTYVYLSGSITSGNSNEFEEAVKDEPTGNGIIIDAKDLEFISSAGLRVILSCKKKCGDKTFKVINVNNDVKNIFDVTGFSEIMEISGSLREVNVDGCELIGAGACGECFRIDDETIIKLYYPSVSEEEIEREKALAKKAFVLGVPTAISYDIVKSNGRTGVVYELIKSKTLGELIRNDYDNREKYIDLYVDVCKKISKIKSDDNEIPLFIELNRADIKKIDMLNDDEKQYLHKFLDLIPNENTCIHGDLNINNIMVENGECCLIDMGEFSRGNHLFDVSRIIFSMEYANTSDGEYNAFYKMNGEQVKEVYKSFMKKFFGEDMGSIKNDPELKWLYPLAWFRCCTAFLRKDRWTKEIRDNALDLFHNHLVPFIEEVSKA